MNHGLQAESIAPQAAHLGASLEQGIAITINDRPVTINFYPSQFLNETTHNVAKHMVEGPLVPPIPSAERIAYPNFYLAKTDRDNLVTALLDPEASQEEWNYTRALCEVLAILQKEPLLDIQTALCLAAKRFALDEEFAPLFQRMKLLAQEGASIVTNRLNTIARLIDLYNIELFLNAVSQELALEHVFNLVVATAPTPTIRFTTISDPGHFTGRGIAVRAPHEIRDEQFNLFKLVCTYPESLGVEIREAQKSVSLFTHDTDIWLQSTL